MFRNHFRIAWRNLVKGKLYSAINILGLSAGIASCLIILLFIAKELSYDTFHKNADRIYRISMSFASDKEWTTSAMAPGPVANIRGMIPEIENMAQLSPAKSETIVERNDVKAYEPGFVYANPSIFDVFDFPLVSGDAVKSLKEPYHVLLSESMAAKYFPGKDPINEDLIINNGQPYKVTGVFNDIPDNSHIRFDFVASLESLYASGLKRDDWYRSQMHTYILLNASANPELLTQKLDTFRDQHMAGPFQLKKGDEATLKLVVTPLTDIHLFTGFSSELIPQGDITYVYIFSAIAFLILVIACINYTNLATAVAASRSHEVGILKVHGAKRYELITQYLSESFLFVGVSLILSVTIAEISLPVVNEIMNREMSIDWGNPMLFIMFAGLWLLVGLGAGFYPAFYISGFNAGRTLKGQLIQSKGVLRKALITFQLTVSIALIACTLVIQNQMAFVRNSKPGFDKAQVIIIPTHNEIGNIYKTFRDRLKAHPTIASVTTSSFQPGEAGMISFYRGKEIEGLSEDESLITDGMDAGFDFEKTFGLNIVQGRSFSESFATDVEEAVMVNESAVRKFGWTDPIGKTITQDKNRKHVVGVIRDFHYKSLRDEIVPLIISPTDEAARFIAIQIHSGKIASAVKQIESTWKELIPQLPFRYSFLDDNFDALYGTELRFNTLVTAFSVLAIVIACLGLLGLSTFTAQQRTKEIGIRKVLGASVTSIVALLTKDFIKWVAMGLLIGIPAAHYAISKWLQTFQYKIEVGPVIYFSAGSIVLLLVVTTTSWQSIRSAQKNPVDTLKYE